MITYRHKHDCQSSLCRGCYDNYRDLSDLPSEPVSWMQLNHCWCDDPSNCGLCVELDWPPEEDTPRSLAIAEARRRIHEGLGRQMVDDLSDPRTRDKTLARRWRVRRVKAWRTPNEDGARR